MLNRNNFSLVALISCAITLSGCIGSDKKSATNAVGSGEAPILRDITAPAITINGDWLTKIELGSPYTELGASAIDNIDGAVPVTQSGSVDTSVLGIHPITYTATDSAGNTGAVVRQVHVADTIAPVLTLAGSSAIEIYRGDVFVEPEGTIAIDSVEGEVAIEIEGEVDITRQGTYTLTYSASDSSGNTSSKTRTVTVLYRPILNIQAKNYFTGSSIEGADISVSLIENGVEAIRTGVTDSRGRFIVILADDTENIIVNGDADGYGEYSAKVLVVDKIVDMFLLPVNAETAFVPTEPAGLDVSGVDIVTLAENSLVDESGDAATAIISAEITVIDPSIDPDFMSGNYETIVAGAVRHIESFGAINVTFDDVAGNSYNLAQGQSATIRIPLASDATSQPATISLYYFDKNTGYWLEEGSATLITENDESYYQGTVSKLGTWSASIVYDQILIKGCVRNSFGAVVNLAEIQTQGVSYFGQTRAVSDSAGNFSIAAKSSSSVLLSATTARSASRTSTIQAGTEDINQAECIVLDNKAIVVTLTWGENPSDLDTQFFGPSTEAGDTPFLVYYNNKKEVINQSTFALDVDDVTGFGPEITTISSFPFAGRYSYAIKHFAGSSSISSSPARVELNFEGERLIFSPPEGEASECWGVLDFVVDNAGAITLETVRAWKSEAYCSANEYRRETISSFSAMSLEEKPSGILKSMIESKYYAK